jgi:hypothetical protein
MSEGETAVAVMMGFISAGIARIGEERSFFPVRACRRRLDRMRARGVERGKRPPTVLPTPRTV